MIYIYIYIYIHIYEYLLPPAAVDSVLILPWKADFIVLQ